MIDILSDAKRRQQGNSLTSPKGGYGMTPPPSPPASDDQLEAGPSTALSRRPVLSLSDNVELILKSVGSRHGSESQDNDQPDYDSVASDEDTDQEPSSCKGDRTKVPPAQPGPFIHG